MKYHACGLTFGIIFCVISLAVLAVSFATDQWINCQVSNNGASPVGPSYNCTYCPEMFYSRQRGLFRTCYPGSSPNWINGYPYLKNSLVDSLCLAERGYAVSPGDPNAQTPYYSNWATYYQRRIDMMRSHWALFLTAIVLLFISCFLGTVGCWRLNSKMIAATTLMLLITVFAIAIGMGLFHGYYYLEQNKIIQAPFMAFVLQNNAYSGLKNATSCNFGYSYALGWVALVTSLVALICFVLVDVYFRKRSIHPNETFKHYQQPQMVVNPTPPKQPDWPITEQSRSYSFFDNVIHHTTVPTTYPIAFDPYDLHLPTGIPASAIRIPRYNQRVPGRFDVPMLHTTYPVNY